MTTQAPTRGQGQQDPGLALTRTSAVDPEIAAAMQLYDRLEPLKNALGLPRDITEPELQLFAMVAHRSGLDPFARQIYAVRRKGKIVFQDGIDGHRATAERTHEYLGSDEATFEEPCPCGKAPADHPAVARVTVHRVHPSGHVVHQVGIARWHELYPGAGDEGFMWRQMMHNQLAKCAEANGLRKAFPKVLGGIYITEEMAQAGPGDDSQLIEAAAKPKAADRLSARRAAREAARESEPEEPTDVEAISFGGGKDVTPLQPPGSPLAMTVDEFVAAVDEEERLKAMKREERLAFLAGVGQRLFPDASRFSDLSDQHRWELWTEVLIELGKTQKEPAQAD